jgi:ABC-type amino acid transport substrate-binding protein
MQPSAIFLRNPTQQPISGGLMTYRILVAAVIASALLACGCSNGKPTAPGTAKSSSAQASTSASATAVETTPADAPPAEMLDGNACVEVTGANLDLATATNHDDARKAGDAFEKYDLPANVKDAIEHFVQTNGAQFDDPDYGKYNKTIDGWVKQVCPLGG